MDQKTSAIIKDHSIKPSQDFKSLMDKGLAYVQGFSGDIWSDYNSHDPGVTILEQFCYGLTELGYKTAFPIEDLLVETLGGRINWEKNSFYSPALVFSSHPYTLADFRKLLIDKFPEIQNCWLKQVYQTGKEDGVNGVFKVDVLPSLAFQRELKKKPELANSFQKKLANFLAQNRNLGEDFDLPTILSPKQIFLQANVEIFAEKEPNEVMAEILFALEVYFYHPVAYSNLEELQKEGVSAEDIFSGPRLTRGFIKDSELKERSNVIYTEKFLQLISKISGVKKCWNLSLVSGSEVKVLNLPEHYYATINTEANDPESIYSTLKISINGNLQRLNKAKVADLLLDLWSKTYRVYQEDLFMESFLQGDLKSRYRNPGRYTSIQHHFPGIYGLGVEGISSHEPVERHAKVRQLKGYLLLMEKHLANYLAQLSHIPDFFDHDFQRLPGTYYSQKLESRIGNDELELKPTLDSGFNASGINPQTGESRLSWLLRKNRVLDHLLARFGEEVNDIPFQLSLKLNLLGSEEEMLSFLLLQKSKMLRLIPELNYGKHKAIFSLTEAEVPVSMLEFHLCLILGIPQNRDTLLPEFLPKDVTDQHEKNSSGLVRSKSSYDDLINKFRPLTKQERDFPQLPDHPIQEFSAGKIGIRELFSRSVDPDSYWVSREHSPRGYTEVLFQKSESNWVSIWEGKGTSEAIAAIGKKIQYFRKLNSSSEGMNLIDHIQLRHLLDDTDFGFVILDEWGNPTFKSPWKKTEVQRKELLSKFYKAVDDPKAFVTSGNILTIVSTEGEVLATYSCEPETDKEKVMESLASLSTLMSGDLELSGLLALSELEGLRLMGTLNAHGVYRQRAVVFMRRMNDGNEIREDFFDLKASLILPDWPARFQESHLRYFLEAEVKNRIPAHMEIAVHWLNLKEFSSFEKVRSNWLKIGTEGDNPQRKAAIGYQLYKFLEDLKGEPNG